MGKQPPELPGDVALRRAVIETARAMSREGLSPGRSGNVSARVPGGMLITPSGLAYDGLGEADIVFVGEGGETLPGSLRPSSEWHLHHAIYAARPEIAAIVHCHSMDATALACAGKPIPAFHYMVTAGGGSDIRLAPYATFGTPELAAAVVAALDGRKAALLAHHGQVACGKDLAAAADLARDVETLAGQYLRTLQIGGGPLLSDDDMQRVLDQFRGYGQQ
ncbi:MULTISPECIES: class II aldolase/adducin family protein [Rhodomicrobium]|uniref:class II aldolase/adducin family protein n=1 Tax=Rhodomicrobium TaxID=1068 RepID=UPI000B4C06E7|nr:MULTISPECIES: class II aldolase/adducin family protein [Rhodomicrobium]